jgi:hypothetical protein
MPLDQFHREESDGPLILDGVERDDIGVIEPRDRARLTLEPGEAIGARRTSTGRTLIATSRPSRTSFAR